MPVSAAVLDAMRDAGCTAEQIVAAVKASMAEDAARANDRRAKDAARKRKSREMSAMSRGQAVTPQDGADPLPPEQKVPTPLKTQPLTPPPSPPKGGSSPTDDVTEAFDAYNVAAKLSGWPVAQSIGQPRRAKLAARLAECGGIAGWRDVLARARGSPFLTGDNDRGWKANLDFFLQQSSFIKVREGAYDGNRTQRMAPAPTSRRSGTDALMAALAAESERPDDWGLDDGGTSRADIAGGPILDLRPAGEAERMEAGRQHS